jgi:hypothetical protein
MELGLKGHKVAILATDGVEQVELIEPRKALDAAGAVTHLISPKEGSIQGMNHDEKADMLPVDRPLSEVRASEYDALLLPGGVANPDALRLEPAAVQVRPRIHARGQASRGDLPRSVAPGGSSRGVGAHADLVAEPEDGHPERRRAVGRPARDHRRSADHEPQAGGHSRLSRPPS